MSYDDDNKRRNAAMKQVQRQAGDRQKANYNREGFVALNERQKVEYWNMQDRTDTWSLGTETGTSQRKIRYYITISDPNLGIYIPKAKATARAVFLKGFRTWYHTYTVDVVQVTIRIFGRQIHIDIAPNDNFEFEFRSSCHPIIDQTELFYGSPLDVYKTAIVRVSVRGSGGKINTAARIVNWRRQEVGVDNFTAIKRGQQIDMITEPMLYPFGTKILARWRYPRTVTESWAPGFAHCGVHYRDTQVGENLNTTALGPVYPLPNPGPTAQHGQRDVDWDHSWAQNHALDPQQGCDLKLVNVDDFPRCSSVQKVSHPIYGEREYGISVDAYGMFRVFAISEIQPQNPANEGAQDIDDAYVRRITPTYPAWCFLATVRQQSCCYPGMPNDALLENLIDNPELDWRFNSVGTRAAVIVYEREAIAFDSTYFGTDMSGTPLTSTMFNNVRDTMGVVGRIGGDAPLPAYNPTRYFMAPGILEAEIVITIDGDLPQNFEVVVNLTTKRRPTNGVYCPMVVGYPWHDVTNDDKEKSVFLQKDVLCSMDIERWGNGGVPPYRDKIQDILVLRRVDTEVAVKTWKAMPLLSCDMTTLSFVALVQELKTDREQTFPSKTDYPGGGNITLKMADFSFGACIVIGTKIKEYLYPETLALDVRLRLEASFGGMSGYEYLATLPGTWTYSTLDDADDGWGDTDVDNVRDWWAYYVGYRATYVGQGPNYIATRDKLFGHWGQEFGDDIHMMYVTNPKWKWSGYASAGCSYNYIDTGGNTFYAHPNGTYCYYDDKWIYNKQGQPIGETVGGTFFAANSLDSFDPLLLEHVIFDRIHFEIRTPLKTLAKKYSFLELYNKAVGTGQKSKKLPENTDIHPIERWHQQATFTKETLSPDPPLDDITWLNLTMTLNGGIWRFLEPGVSGGVYHNVTMTKICGMVGVSLLNERWQPDPGQAYEPPFTVMNNHQYFYKFCDPQVLSALT
jgi:hypothetical protein